MQKKRNANEKREAERCACQIRRFYKAWYRNYPKEKPEREPVTDPDFDRWLAELMELRNHSAVNNARLGNQPLGRSRIESLHDRLRPRLYEDQNGVRLWCLHWVQEERSAPRAKAIPSDAQVVTLRRQVPQVYIIVGATLDPRSISVGEPEPIRGGGFRLPIEVSYKGSK